MKALLTVIEGSQITVKVHPTTYNGITLRIKNQVLAHALMHLLTLVAVAIFSNLSTSLTTLVHL